MKKCFPTQILCDEFKELIKETKENEVKRYLIRSYQSFKDGHLEAAIMLAWSGVERYYTLVCDSIGRWFFKQVYQKLNNGRNPHDLTVAVLDSISHKTQIFRSFKINPDDPKSETRFYELKELRHQVAHGRGIFVTDPNLVWDKIRTIRPLIFQQVTDQKFYHPENIIKILIEMKVPREIKNLFRHFPNDVDWLPIAYRLNGKFFGQLKADKEIESLKKIARTIYDELTPSKRKEAWENFAYQALAHLSEVSEPPKTRYEIYNFLPRPPQNQNSSVRDQFLTDFINWLDIILDDLNNQFTDLSSEDILEEFEEESDTIRKLIGKLRRDTPGHLNNGLSKILDKWDIVKNLLEEV